MLLRTIATAKSKSPSLRRGLSNPIERRRCLCAVTSSGHPRCKLCTLPDIDQSSTHGRLYRVAQKKVQRVYFESNTFCLIIYSVDSRLASSLEQSSERDQNCEILATFKKNLKLIYSARTLTSQPEMRVTQWSWTKYWRSINFITY